MNRRGKGVAYTKENNEITLQSFKKHSPLVHAMGESCSITGKREDGDGDGDGDGDSERDGDGESEGEGDSDSDGDGDGDSERDGDGESEGEGDSDSDGDGDSDSEGEGDSDGDGDGDGQNGTSSPAKYWPRTEITKLLVYTSSSGMLVMESQSWRMGRP
jgi:hypothetical protein